MTSRGISAAYVTAARGPERTATVARVRRFFLHFLFLAFFIFSLQFYTRI